MNPLSKSERTRQFIIEATAGVFNEKGYAGTSLSDLTKVTRLTKGSIYGNFDNKEEVALAAFDYNLARRSLVVRQKVARAVSSKDKLLAYINAYNSVESNGFPAGGCPLLNTGTEADDTNEPLRKRVADGILHWKNDLVAIIQDGMAANEFRDDTDASQLALSIIALIEGGILISRTAKDPRLMDTVLETAKDLINRVMIEKSAN